MEQRAPLIEKPLKLSDQLRCLKRSSLDHSVSLSAPQPSFATNQAATDKRDESDASVDAALAATESTAWQHRRLHELSGDERQRVLLSRALATQSPVLLLDEPTTHLDPPHQVALARLFRRLATTHTVITVLQDLPLAVQADRLLVMRDGAVTGHGESHDAALHVALVDAFDRAIAVIPTTASGKRPTVSLRLDD